MSGRPEVHPEQTAVRDGRPSSGPSSGHRLIEADLRLLVEVYGRSHPAARALEIARDMTRPVFHFDGRRLFVGEVDVTGRLVDPLADTVVLPRVTGR